MPTKTKEKKVEQSTAEYAPVETCAHFWVIESPNGPTSVGTCKRCGERREFMNIVPQAVPPAPRNREKNPLTLPRMGEVAVGEEEHS
ncbi:MAG: hypothetical protein ABID87_01695 [Chloroflexota bacterium]